jgi:hypothetical protein
MIRPPSGSARATSCITKKGPRTEAANAVSKSASVATGKGFWVRGSAGVADDYIDVAELRDRLTEEAADVRNDAHVRLNRNRTAAIRFDGCNHAGGIVSAASIVDGDGGAVRGQAFGDGTADAAR